MAILLFYQEPVLLDRNEHRKLRLKKPVNLDFAKDVNAVPITGVEFFEASRELPVLFTKDSSNEFIPVAILSLQSSGHNLGDSWGDVYMPAFIRRYPFALSAEGDVIFDKQAPHLQEQEGDALFREDGQNSDFLNNILGFLNHMDKQFKETQAYCKACAENDLFTPYKVQVKIENNKFMRMDTLSVLDDKKLSNLPEQLVTDWFRKGWLAWSYAHLHSLGAMRRLVNRERQVGSKKTSGLAGA